MSEEQPPPDEAEGKNGVPASGHSATPGEDAEQAADAHSEEHADGERRADDANADDAHADDATVERRADIGGADDAGADVHAAGHDPAGEEHPTQDLERPRAVTGVDSADLAHAVVAPGDIDRAGLSDEAVPAEATEDHPEEVPPDPGSADAASPRMQSMVESLLFAADKALTLKQLADLVGETEIARVRAAVAAIELHYQSRGFQLHQVAGGYQFRTNPENAQWVQKLLAQKPVKLSRAQIETMAICAYRQPVTRPEIDEIRGVDSGGTLKTLLDRSLIRIVGKKEEPGRPILYGTTKEFLEFFNLRDLKDLPTLREFHELSEEHQAQVAALEGRLPAGSIEGKDEPPAPDAPPPLTRLEITTPPEDAEELEEIDRLIRTAGVTTDQDQPAGADAEPTPPDEFDHEPTREYDSDIMGEPTRVHGNTITAPHVGDLVDEEFDRSETTSKKPRPENLDDEPEEAN